MIREKYSCDNNTKRELCCGRVRRIGGGRHVGGELRGTILELGPGGGTGGRLVGGGGAGAQFSKCPQHKQDEAQAL